MASQIIVDDGEEEPTPIIGYKDCLMCGRGMGEHTQQQILECFYGLMDAYTQLTETFKKSLMKHSPEYHASQ